MKLRSLFILLLLGTSLHAGQYLQDFSTAADAATNLADGSQITGTIAKVTDVTFKELQLSAQGIGSTRSAFLLPDLDPGLAVQAFSAKWNASIKGDFPNAADGFSFNFGQIGSLSLTNSTYSQESGFGTGLSFDVQTYTGNNPGFYLRINGNIIAFASYNPSVQWGTNNTMGHYFEVDWNYFTGMTVRVDNNTIFSNISTAQFTPAAGDRFAWAARCGAISESVSLDNIIVMTGGNLVPMQPRTPYYGDTDFNGSFPKSLAFDGNDSTAWFPQSGAPITIGATYPEPPGPAVACAVTCLNSTDRSSDPFNVGVDASGDGSNWGSRGTNQLRFRAGKETRPFSFTDKTTVYTAYRLNIQSTYVNNVTPGVAEFRLYRFAPMTAVLPWKKSSAPVQQYGSISASSDLRVIATCASFEGGGGGLHISTNYGQSWFNGDLPANSWTCVAVSSDGTKMAAGGCYLDGGDGAQGLALYVSGNSGVNWTNTHNTNSWNALTMSPDGKTIVGGCFFNQGMFISTNFGTTFTPVTAPTETWLSLSMSTNAKTMIGGATYFYFGSFQQDHGVYLSTNSGAVWTLVTNLPYSNASWDQVACSADGKTMAAVGNYGVFVSHDTGATWQFALGGGFLWYGVAMSADGRKMVAASTRRGQGYTSHGELYVSADSGANWQMVPSSSTTWSCLVSSADGRRMAGGSIAQDVDWGNGNVWLSYLPGLNLTRTNNTNVLSWTTDQIGFLVQQTTNLSTGSWQLTSTNSLTTSNGMYQVAIPNDSPTKFFRLLSP